MWLTFHSVVVVAAMGRYFGAAQVHLQHNESLHYDKPTSNIPTLLLDYSTSQRQQSVN